MSATSDRTACINQPQPPADHAVVALYVTCLVNSLRPSVGFATASLLEAAGFRVVVPETQTCCGQPNYNNGDPASARRAAMVFIETFEDFPYIIVPSASCAGMIRNHYPRLLENHPQWQERLKRVNPRVYELADFLWHHHDRLPVNSDFCDTLTHHDSCSALREVAVSEQVRLLIHHCLPNATFRELQEPEACCGFGGTFCVKFNAVSRKMGHNKLTDIVTTGAALATSLDSSCLMQLQSLQNASDTTVSLLHLAELLAREITP